MKDFFSKGSKSGNKVEKS